MSSPPPDQKAKQKYIETFPAKRTLLLIIPQLILKMKNDFSWLIKMHQISVHIDLPSCEIFIVLANHF